MIINLISQDHSSVQEKEGSVVYVTFSSNSEGKEKITHIHNKELQNKLAKSISQNLISGKANEVITYREFTYKSATHLIVVGLGKVSAWDHEVFRQALAAAQDVFTTLQASEVIIDLNQLGLKNQSSEAVQGVVEGLTLASYNFSELKSKKENKKTKKMIVNIFLKEGKDKAVQKSFEEALFLAQSVNFSKYLGDMPGNLMTPEILAQKTLEAIKGTKIKATIWNKQRITKEKMGGLLGVSKGSSQDPRFIILEYNGASNKSKKPIIFVGKGLTFDSGGISIKPSTAMEEMKYDMCGGANVIGTIIAIAKLKLKVNVMALVPATENMPGPAAAKPGDVLTFRNGKTSEVNNTDAEGRLILADALAYACEQKPEIVIDAATLTGAMVVALGNIHTGYFTRDKELKERVESAAEKSGEWVWNMPLCDFHVQDMKGTFADLSNMSSGKGAGSATAAAFLEQFVSEGVPWAHFDIAGTGWAAGNRLRYCTKKGATGVMIRTFVELARSFE